MDNREADSWVLNSNDNPKRAGYLFKRLYNTNEVRDGPFHYFFRGEVYGRGGGGGGGEGYRAISLTYL